MEQQRQRPVTGTLSLFGFAFLALLAVALSLPMLTHSPQVFAQSSKPSSSTSQDIFTRRILPIFRAGKPSTCMECHLSGVDLKNYIRPTEEGTFASLRDQGLIDVRNPDRSHILRLIRMSNPKTPRLTQEARNGEYTAFRDWIVASTKNQKFLALPKTSAAQRARPKATNAVLRHTRKDALLASFVRNVWAQEGRCMGCHRAGTPENDANVKKYGARVAWFVSDSPEETMRRVIAQKLVNVDAPEQSLLLLKPLNKVPHGGGVKFLMGDGGYKLFRAWIEDYTKSLKGAYKSERDLPTPPTDTLTYSESILNVTNAPAPWANRLLRVDAYAWDAKRNDWNQKPTATGDRQVGANGETNVLMFLRVSVGDTVKNVRLEQGRYLLKYYVDSERALEQNYALPTDSPKLYKGQQEVTVAWGRGWGNLTRVALAPK